MLVKLMLSSVVSVAGSDDASSLIHRDLDGHRFETFNHPASFAGLADPCCA
jgi:hypothetical protein